MQDDSDDEKCTPLSSTNAFLFCVSINCGRIALRTVPINVCTLVHCDDPSKSTILAQLDAELTYCGCIEKNIRTIACITGDWHFSYEIYIPDLQLALIYLHIPYSFSNLRLIDLHFWWGFVSQINSRGHALLSSHAPEQLNALFAMSSEFNCLDAESISHTSGVYRTIYDGALFNWLGLRACVCRYSHPPGVPHGCFLRDWFT